MVEWCTQNLRQNVSISRGINHATPKERYQYTTYVGINNTRYKRIQSLIQNHMPMCAVSLLESREQRYIKAMNNNNNNLFNAELSPKRYWRGPRSQEVGEEGNYILIIIIHSFYIALFSALEQTDCAH